MSTPAPIVACITEVTGHLVRARASAPVRLGEVVYVGEAQLMGEVIALSGDEVTAQVYEDTTGLSAGAPLLGTGAPLQVTVGPGLLGSVYDGLQRPLEALARDEGAFLSRGARRPALDLERLWDWTPKVQVDDLLRAGDLLGELPETPALTHRILVPPALGGRVVEVRAAGPVRIEEVVVRLAAPDGSVSECTLFHRCPVRVGRPIYESLPPDRPLVTGQRVLDTFFTLPRGGAAGLPGGFGTGKTILQHQLARWADADVTVFVGCGERGNEMTHMLRELPELTDPRTGRPLAERTILVANTSNMPVSAREASIYTGVTLAEYYRDMGYDVAMLADSTSRWAEALREISGRLEEMPAEEGYPPYLSSRLAALYERAGRVRTRHGAEGSVTLISAISPPGGDLTEPVTRHTQSLARTFWTLDKARAEARVYPAVSVTESYGDLPAAVEAWWRETSGEDWSTQRADALALLEEAEQLASTARLIGAEALPERQRFLLGLGTLFEEAFLRQSAYDPLDAYCSPARQTALLSLLLSVRDAGLEALAGGAAAAALLAVPELTEVERAKERYGDEALGELLALGERVARAFQKAVPAGDERGEVRP